MVDSATELQQLGDVLPQYEDQIRYWESQLEAISNVRADIVQAQETLNGMLASDKEMEMMVPVGHNTSIFTTVDDLARILVGLGSRVYMEATRADSLERLSKRLEGLEKAGKSYQENLSKSQKDYVALRERAEYLNSNPEAK